MSGKMNWNKANMASKMHDQGIAVIKKEKRKKQKRLEKQADAILDGGLPRNKAYQSRKNWY